MGFATPDIEEYTLHQLEAEIKERLARKAAGLCTYCKADVNNRWNTKVCKFPKRHYGQEF